MILGGRYAPVLGPLDLGCKVCRWSEVVGLRKFVRYLTKRDDLRGKQLSGRLRGKFRELKQSGGVKGAGIDLRNAEGRKPAAHLARSLVGERHGEDLVRRERTSRYLVGYAPSDRRRLARARPREDANGTAHGFNRTTLFRVQTLEDRCLLHSLHPTGGQRQTCEPLPIAREFPRPRRNLHVRGPQARLVRPTV